MTIRRSAFVMSITPFAANGALDEPAYRAHLRRLCAAGVGVYVGGSASGEGFSLSPEERDRVLAIAIEELKGKVPVRAMGCEVRHLAETLDYLQATAPHALDAVHVFAPEMGHASKPTTAELETYYGAAIAATAHRVVLSTYQALGFDVPVALLERLVARFPQIAGFFYGGTDARYLSTVIARLADRIEIHCAGPYNALTTLGLGGAGFMGHEGNLSPELPARVIAAFERGDLA
ncbi:MAG: dihydrodipicolinate synthase family protein, partial [Casimicrobiaceae bacterium]